MFRNFVSPASLDRDGVRSSAPPDGTLDAYSHPGQHVQSIKVNGSINAKQDGVPNGYTHASSSSSSSSSSPTDGYRQVAKHSGATIVQSADATAGGGAGGYTTSIFVNGRGPTSKQEAAPRAHHNNAHAHFSQNAPSAVTQKTRPTSNGMHATPECPQSPHPSTHPRHAYTPINSSDLGLASLSISEVDDDEQERLSTVDNNVSTYAYADTSQSRFVHNDHSLGRTNNNTNNNNHNSVDIRHFHYGNGSSSGRAEVHHSGDPSLYPIQDEQEEEDDGAGDVSNDVVYPHGLIDQSNQSLYHNHHHHYHDVPSQMYHQKVFNVLPPPPPSLEQIFAGRRDVRDPKSAAEKQIVSAKGTVRGFKNRVKAGIATFWAQPEDQILEYEQTQQTKITRNFRSLEQGKIVVYATSMCVVRETSERCKVVRHLLQNHMVRYEERDLYMSREIQQELKYRLCQEGIEMLRLPHVFADGICIGGAEELERFNEAGELRALLNNYQKIVVRINCENCGGYRFTPCDVCHGSKRSLLRNHFTEEFCALRCMHCNESGLRRCELCKDQQE